MATWDEPDIEPETAKRLFTENILRLSPSSLTENGFRCFDKFFRMVNLNQHGLSKWNRSCFVTENIDDLIGMVLSFSAVSTIAKENNFSFYKNSLDTCLYVPHLCSVLLIQNTVGTTNIHEADI